jgi:hypothetical protein
MKITSKSIDFFSSCSHWVSSYRAEIFGFLASIIILPLKSHVTLYTDSNSMIESYNQLSSCTNLSIRNRFKIQSDGMLWSLIRNNTIIRIRCRIS